MIYFIKFNDKEDYIQIENFQLCSGHKNYINIKKNTEYKITYSNKGFKIYIQLKNTNQEGQEEIQYQEFQDFSNYVLLYNETEDEMWLTNDTTIWGIYYLYNPDTTYVERVYIGLQEDVDETYHFEHYVLMKQSNMADVCEDTIRPPYDDEGYYKYKVIDGQVIPVDKDEKVRPEDFEEESSEEEVIEER